LRRLLFAAIVHSPVTGAKRGERQFVEAVAATYLLLEVIPSLWGKLLDFNVMPLTRKRTLPVRYR
jgi:hypothetical protein